MISIQPDSDDALPMSSQNAHLLYPMTELSSFQQSLSQNLYSALTDSQDLQRKTWQVFQKYFASKLFQHRVNFRVVWEGSNKSISKEIVLENANISKNR